MHPFYLSGPAGVYVLENGTHYVFPGTGIVWTEAEARELEALGLTVDDPPASAPEAQDAGGLVVEIDSTGDEEAVLTPEAAAAAAAESETTDPPAEIMTTDTLHGQAGSKRKRR